MTPRVATAAPARIDRDEIRRTVAGYLRIDPALIDPAEPLTAYGIDSLGALELVASLEDRFECDLPESLLTDWPTLDGLVSALIRDPLAPSSTGTPSLERMLADSRLPPEYAVPACVSSSDTPVHYERRVLVTGATGFLGTSLVRAFLDEGWNVVCLVRPLGGADAGARFECAMRRYGLWRGEDSSRVLVVPGDLEQPSFGLDAAAYDGLCASVTTVCHAAADVNWVSSYDALRSSNVMATAALLRFARTGTPKAFQFVSSLSVCYATNGPAEVSADDDMLPYVGALPLGYAQSKCVAEALVRQAAERGLPAQVFRPALLAGHSRSGISNIDDLIAALLKGCIQLGAAPDLDWTFDAVPVDTAADAIARAAATFDSALQTHHLRHPRPRHWRECVLWTNLFGYPMVLEPYPAWVDRLVHAGGSNALHRLRSFFTRSVDGRTVPEHYEEHVRSRTGDGESLDVAYPPLDASRLDSYFTSFIDRGFLHRPATSPVRATLPDMHVVLREPVEHAMRRHLRDDGFRLTRFDLVAEGSEHSIIGELTSWKRRRRTGLFQCRVESQEAGRVPHGLIVKIKPPDDDVLDVAETTAFVCDARVANEIVRFRERLGIRGSQKRELAVYEESQSHTALAAHMPRCYGTWTETPEIAGIVMERLSGMEVIDSANDARAWSDAHIAAAIDGIARVHGAFAGRQAELCSRDWIGYVQTASGAADMQPLWSALAAHAAPAFESWAGAALAATHRELVETVGLWWPALERGPRTLIHHDFNSRNVGIRRTEGGLTLVAYDWELATVGAPQRDLAELLCFVLPDDAEEAAVKRWVEHHRLAFERESRQHVCPSVWLKGFRAAMNELLVSRLAFYALIHRIRPQAFLPRVIRTWMRLHEMEI